MILAAIFLGGTTLVVHARAAPARSAALHITERDFRISAPKHVASGNLTVTVVNKGPDDHELIIVRATTARLPLRSDGLTANEETLTPIIAPTEPAPPGTVRSTRPMSIFGPAGTSSFATWPGTSWPACERHWS